MQRWRLLFGFLHVIKLIFSVAITFLLLYPAALVHIQPDTNVQVNDSIDVSMQMTCRKPRPNVKLMEKDLFQTLHLPEGSLLTDQLYDLARCKASAAKMGASVNGCFCLGYWPIYFCSFLISFGCLVNLSDVVWVLKKRNDEFSAEECQTQQRFALVLIFVNMFVTCVVILQIGSLNDSLRYTLPKSVQDLEYYEVPLTWWLAFLLCAVSSLFVSCEWFLAKLTEIVCVAVKGANDEKKEEVIFVAIKNPFQPVVERPAVVQEVAPVPIVDNQQPINASRAVPVSVSSSSLSSTLESVVIEKNKSTDVKKKSQYRNAVSEPKSPTASDANVFRERSFSI